MALQGMLAVGGGWLAAPEEDVSEKINYYMKVMGIDKQVRCLPQLVADASKFNK